MMFSANRSHTFAPESKPVVPLRGNAAMPISRRSLIAQRGLAFVLALASTGWLTGCSGLPADAVQKIKQARIAHDAGQYDRCAQILTPVINAYAGRRDLAEAYYLRGQCEVRSNARDTARNDLRLALRLARDKTLRALIDTQLGNVAFDEHNYDLACVHYGRSVTQLPKHAPTDRALFQYGVALQRMGRFPTARRVFGRMLTDYPHSTYAAQAVRKRDWSDAFFAVQCGSFSNAVSARNAAAALRNRGLDAQAFPELQNGGTRLVVRVGHYPSYAAANHALTQIRSAVPDAFIVP